MRQYKLKIHKDYEPTQLYTGELARLNSLKVRTEPMSYMITVDYNNSVCPMYIYIYIL